MRTWKRVAVSAVMGVGVLALTALPAAATTHKTTTTTHPKKKAHKSKGIAKSAAGKQFLADIAPYNAADDTFSAKSKSVTQYSQLASLVAPVVASLQSFDAVALRQQWPAGVKQDIKTMVTADGAYEGDLSALGNADAANISSVEASVTKDGNTSAADSNIVRSDLGLPPPSP